MIVHSARPWLCSLAALSMVVLPARLIAQAPVAGGHPAGPPPGGPPSAVNPPTMPPEVQKAVAAQDRAIKLDRAGKVPEAIAAYREFLRLAQAARLPASSQAPSWKRLATLYEERNDAKGVETALKQSVLLDPNDPLPLIQLATIYSQQQRFDEAKQAATRALALKPKAALAAPAHFVIGGAAIAKGDTATAEHEYGLAVQLAPNNPQARFNHGLVLAQQKKYAPALAELERARKLAPKLTAVRLYEGALYQEMGKWTESLAAYMDVLAVEPTNAVALFNRALVLQRMGPTHTGDAISAYLDTLAAMPGNYEAQFNVAQLYSQIGNFTAARSHFEAAHKLNPKDTRSLVGLALSVQKEAMFSPDPKQREVGLKLAESHLKAAIALAPKDESLQRQLASLYADMGHYDDAVAVDRKRIAATPGNAEPYFALANVYTRQRKMDEVVKVWKEYRTHKPQDPTSYEQAATALEATGKWDPAIVEWKALLEQKPKNGVAANAMVAIGKDQMAAKRPEEARTEFKAVLALDPSGKDVPHEYQAAEVATLQAERIEAWRSLALLAQSEKKTDEVVQWWNEVKKEYATIAAKSGKPDTLNPEAYYAIARLYQDDKKPDLAIQEYRSLAQALSKEPKPHEEIGQIYADQGKIEEAVAEYRLAADLSKDPLNDRMKIAETYRRAGKTDLALDEYRTLAQKYPNNTPLLTALALTLKQAGKDAESLTVYDALIKADSNLHWVPDYKAIALTNLKRYGEARAIYVDELDHNPLSYQTYADLEHVYVLEGNQAGYLAWLQPRFEKIPHNNVLMGVVIDQYIRQNREPAGWDYLRGVVEKHKSERPVMEAYATLLQQHDKRAEAAAVYRQIAAQYPKDLIAQTDLAEHLDANGQKDEAARIYRDQIARQDLPADQQLNLRRRFAERCILQGDKAEAIAQYQQVLHDQPNDLEAASTLAQLLAESGRDTEAVPLYQRLAAQSAYAPTLRARIRTRLAGIYEKQGRKTDAIGEYQEALKLNPNDADATAGLKRLGVP